jgi:uncharacterized protein YndB with AHSA1/START domain
MSESLVIEAVRKTVTVDCTVEEAFRVFTSDAISWWPIATHSVHGDAVKEIVFEEHEGGEVYELSSSGERSHWAAVVSWEPPTRLVLAWNILERETVPTEVEVRFLPEGTETRVELEHRGWGVVAEDAACKRSNYDSGWEHILGIFAEQTRR